MKRPLLALLCLSLLLLVLLLPGLPWSKRYHHALKKMVVKAEMRLAKWRGMGPRLATITGKLIGRVAVIEALNSPSGWATMTDAQGRFILPDVTWYPGASYDLIVAADAYNARRFMVTAPLQLSEADTFDVGEIHFDQGREIDPSKLPGINSVTYQAYDADNQHYYRRLFDKLTKGEGSDEAKLEAINQYVATRLNYDETAWNYDSPRQILERGSRYCGHLSTAMAAIVEAAGYKVRVVDMSDGTAKPNTHVVVEVYYRNRWHLFDPTFGVVFRNKRGEIASYKEIRLDTNLIVADAFRRHGPEFVKAQLSWMPGVYGSGFHHFYHFKKNALSCHL